MIPCVAPQESHETRAQRGIVATMKPTNNPWRLQGGHAYVVTVELAPK